MTETVDLAKLLRVTLLGGILGSVGAGLGLIIWLASKAISPELGVTIVVGAVVGVSVHWIEEYIHAAKHSSMVADAPEEEPDSHKSATSAVAALLWGTGFGFLGLACEHLVAHLLAVYLLPFLATMANLAPAGMLIAASMYQGRGKDENALMVVLYGALLGLWITVITAVILWLGWGSADFWNMLCWWVMVGVGVRIVTPKQPAEVRFYQPAVGVVVALCFTLVAANYLSLIPVPQTRLLSDMAKQVLNSTGLPDQFWKPAEDALKSEAAGSHGHAKRSASVAKISPKPAAQGSAPPARGSIESIDMSPVRIGSPKPGLGSIIAPRSPLLPPGPVERTHAAVTEAPKQETVAQQAEEITQLAGKNHQTTDEDIRDAINRQAAPPPPYVATPKLERSWLVLMLFALGIGCALWVVEVLKPEPYEGSITARKDLTLAVVTFLALVGACTYARLNPIHEPPDPPGQGHAQSG